jgi:glycosyltransferase involved in cell wall biosynthesis
VSPELLMKNFLKVLHVGKYYAPYKGGIETHLQMLCGALSSSVDVSAMVANSCTSDKEEYIDGVYVTRVGTKLTIASAPLCPGMISRLRVSAADLIHIHLPNPTAVLAYLASGHKGVLVVTYHSDTVQQSVLGSVFEPILHRFLRRSSAIIATSPDYLRTSDVLARHTSRCHVVPLGIPIEEFSSCSAAEVKDLKDRFGDRLVVAVGRMVYYKGFKYLIEAMTNIKGHLLIIGDGPLRADLQRTAASHGVSQKVTFLGAVEKIVPYYHAASVFAFPSIARSEAFGIVQIEAMAAGKPVVNTSLDSGVPFVSQHGVTGLTVPPKDAAALAAAITRLLDDDRLRASYSQAARLRARSEFSLETMTARTHAVYEGVTGCSIPKSRTVNAVAGSL